MQKSLAMQAIHRISRLEEPSNVTAVVVGRWTGTRRIQVRLDDGRFEVVESAGSAADDVDPGDSVVVSFDPEGRALDWRPASQRRGRD